MSFFGRIFNVAFHNIVKHITFPVLYQIADNFSRENTVNCSTIISHLNHLPRQTLTTHTYY